MNSWMTLQSRVPHEMLKYHELFLSFFYFHSKVYSNVDSNITFHLHSNSNASFLKLLFPTASLLDLIFQQRKVKNELWANCKSVPTSPTTRIRWHSKLERNLIALSTHIAFITKDLWVFYCDIYGGKQRRKCKNNCAFGALNFHCFSAVFIPNAQLNYPEINKRNAPPLFARVQ